jgi:CheY-like chemotaxis protein
VKTRAAGPDLVLEVRDTGCGIPAPARARIFEPFFTTKSPEKGTGLGLSTVKRITEQLSGRIDLESEVGKGTTFRLVFPRCEPPPELKSVSAHSPAAVAEVGTVLLVEDDRLIRASLLRFLESKGYAVLVAASPSEAIGAAREHGSIDLLLTDVVLPEMTGSELAAKLFAGAPRMKVVYMSAHPRELLNAQGLLREGAPYLEKPFEMEALEEILSRALVSSERSGGVPSA